jgi:hypothetical protein
MKTDFRRVYLQPEKEPGQFWARTPGSPATSIPVHFAAILGFSIQRQIQKPQGKSDHFGVGVYASAGHFYRL